MDTAGTQQALEQTAWLHACAGATKREPVVVGKPSDFVLAAISDTVGVPRDRMCMIGDRLDTDILFGQQGGLDTMLVLSGGQMQQAFLPLQARTKPAESHWRAPVQGSPQSGSC